MCYRLRHVSSISSILEYLPDLVIDPQMDLGFQPDKVIEAHQLEMNPVITNVDGQPALRLHAWGLTGKKTMHNPEERRKYLLTQSERVFESGSLWNKLRHQRCLIPVQGIFEHRHITNYSLRGRAIKTIPYHISQKHRPWFAIPGFYHHDTVLSHSLITRAANPLMRMIHNGGANPYRMPLFLPFVLEQLWLKPDLSDQEMRNILSFCMPSEHLDHYTAFPLNHDSIRRDGKHKFAPYSWPGLKPLGEDIINVAA